MVKINIILSFIYYFIMMMVGVFTYKYLWGNVSEEAFKYWVIIFELSLILMLMDFGFTQKYIKNSIYNKQSKSIELGDLRGVLIKYGVLIFLILFFYSWIVGIYKYISYFDLLLIFLSFFINFISYAETANLKVKEKLVKINIAQLVSTFFFIMPILFLNFDPITNISIGMLLRSLTLYIIQIEDYYFSLKGFIKPDFDAVQVNMSYFLLFTIDLLVLDFLKVDTYYLVILGVYLKYFNVVRGVMDIVNNYLFLYINNWRFMVFSLVFTILGYIFLGLVCDYILAYFFNDFSSFQYFSLILCVNFILINFYRIYTNKIYYTNNSFYFNRVILAIVFLKILFFSLMYNTNSLYVSYTFQCLLLMVLLFIINRGFFWKKAYEIK